MSNIIPFNFEGMDVRLTDVDGNPWFILKDVCEVLDYTDSAQAARNLEEDEIQTLHNVQGITKSRNGIVKLVSESGLYSLILTSRKPEAKRFKKWVVGEVLPSIRKTKSYSLDRQAYLREALHDVPSLQFLVHECTVKIQELQEEVAESQPKVEAFNRIAVSDGGMCITNAAKTLGLRPKDLFDILSGMKWIYRRLGSKNWVAYQDKLQRGLLEHKVTEVTRSDGSTKITEQVLVTPKGLSHLAATNAIATPHSTMDH